MLYLMEPTHKLVLFLTVVHQKKNFTLVLSLLKTLIWMKLQALQPMVSLLQFLWFLDLRLVDHTSVVDQNKLINTY